MTYRVVSIFETVQGEGAHAGRSATFIRFAGCNAWDGNPEHRDRSKGACGAWCDTEFRHGEPLTAEAIAAKAKAMRPRFAVLTGGEPLLQVDAALVEALIDFSVAVETNGSMSVAGIHAWVTCSPKRGMPLVVERADELKVVLPGGRDPDGSDGWTDEELVAMAKHYPGAKPYVQPQDPIDPSKVEAGFLTRRDGNERGDFHRNVRRCLEFVHAHPGWRLGVQAHKIIGVP